MDDADFEKFVANLVIVLALIGIVVLLATAKPKTGPDYYSALYLKPDGYQNYIAGGKTWFTYVIENHEASDKTYTVTISVAGEVKKSTQVRVKQGQKVEGFEEFFLREKSYVLPFTVRVTATTGGKEYEVHYWVKQRP